MKPDDIEFQDAVVSIPKNAIWVTLNIKTIENGEVKSIQGDFDPPAIREAFQKFDDTVSGEYPKYVITEEGRKYVEQLMKEGEA